MVGRIAFMGGIAIGVVLSDLKRLETVSETHLSVVITLRKGGNLFPECYLMVVIVMVESMNTVTSLPTATDRISRLIVELSSVFIFRMENHALQYTKALSGGSQFRVWP